MPIPPQFLKHSKGKGKHVPPPSQAKRGYSRQKLGADKKRAQLLALAAAEKKYGPKNISQVSKIGK